jgi:hypothetical protein
MTSHEPMGVAIRGKKEKKKKENLRQGMNGNEIGSSMSRPQKVEHLRLVILVHHGVSGRREITVTKYLL